MNPELLQLLFKAQAAAENLIRAARDVKSYEGYLIASMNDSCEDDSFIAKCGADFAELGKTLNDAEHALMEVSGAILSGNVLSGSTPVSQGAESEYVGEYQGEGDCQITVFTPHY